jgi:hypothetical protein
MLAWISSKYTSCIMKCSITITHFRVVCLCPCVCACVCFLCAYILCGCVVARSLALSVPVPVPVPVPVTVSASVCRLYWEYHSSDHFAFHVSNASKDIICFWYVYFLFLSAEPKRDKISISSATAAAHAGKSSRKRFVGLAQYQDCHEFAADWSARYAGGCLCVCRIHKKFCRSVSLSDSGMSSCQKCLMSAVN